MRKIEARFMAMQNYCHMMMMITIQTPPLYERGFIARKIEVSNFRNIFCLNMPLN